MLGPVMWIFEADDQEQTRIEGKLNKLLDHRTRFGKSTPLLKALFGCRIAMGAEHLWGGHLLKDLLSEMEDSNDSFVESSSLPYFFEMKDGSHYTSY